MNINWMDKTNKSKINRLEKNKVDVDAYLWSMGVYVVIWHGLEYKQGHPLCAGLTLKPDQARYLRDQLTQALRKVKRLARRKQGGR